MSAHVEEGKRRQSLLSMASEKGVNLTVSAGEIQVAEILDVQATAAEEKRVLRKIDRWILPFMALAYMLQFMDKVTLGYATQLGLIKDLKLVGTQYSWASSIFYFGYLIFEFPSSYFVVRWPLGKYLAITVAIWGGILMCHGACNGFVPLMVVRFLLGAFEAAVAPGFGLIIGMFYTRDEQPSRQMYWYTGNCVANIVSGVIAYGIGRIESSLATWRLLFIILGAITASYGVVLYFVLPDSVATARFLNKEEKAIALRRILVNKTGVMDEGKYKIDQLWDALKDPQAWALTLYQISISIPNGGITNFNSIIIAGFGFSPLNTLLVQMPAGVVQLIALFTSSFLVTKFKNRRLAVMLFMVTLSLTGIVIVYVLPNSNPWGRLVGIWLCAPFAVNLPLGLSLITSNVGGMTKRSTIAAMMFIGYCAGNIIGPQFFYTYEAPKYPTGLTATLIGFAFGIFFLAALLGYYIFENRRRNRKYGVPVEHNEADELSEEFSNKTDRQIPSFRYKL